VDRVQNAVSSVIGDFLQQFFTFLFGLVLVSDTAEFQLALLLLFLRFTLRAKIGREVATRSDRAGQACRDTEYRP